MGNLETLATLCTHDTGLTVVKKRQRKQKTQSRMCNQETLAALNTQATGRWQTKRLNKKNENKITKKMNNTDPINNVKVLAKGMQFLLLKRNPQLCYVINWDNQLCPL